MTCFYQASAFRVLNRYFVISRCSVATTPFKMERYLKKMLLQIFAEHNLKIVKYLATIRTYTTSPVRHKMLIISCLYN